ncbi:MAG: DNA-3-methyladenine glycosylase [Flavobacteriales bacterium]|nr:DNA-3-methyladenine glycosylase [Flavobacteriales bacterium]
MLLPRSFYLRDDVVPIARDLLGMTLHTRIDGQHVSAAITETEAYAGINDRASHAYGGRRTPRNEMMYAEGGRAYVYICYGIHHLLNIVTHLLGVPHAVLVRGVRAIEGATVMDRRRGRAAATTDGPGTAAQAMGIRRAHDGTDLLGASIWIEDDGVRYPDQAIVSGPRIGVNYAGADALLPYRFFLRKGS